MSKTGCWLHFRTCCVNCIASIGIHQWIIVFLVLAAGSSCKPNSRAPQVITINSSTQTSDSLPQTISKQTAFCQLLCANGFVNVQTVDSSIRIDLRYSTTNNLWGRDWYNDFDSAYLQTDVAQRLAQAHTFLKKSSPNLRFVIYDALRPLSIQQQLWDSAPVSAHERQRLLSNPQLRSLHNYGAAVDLGIVDISGHELDMGTTFDDSNERSYPSLEAYFVSKGQLTAQQQNNRLLLRTAMRSAGFIQNQYEWWHYSACLRAYAARNYALVESFVKIDSSARDSKMMASVESLTNDTLTVRFSVQIGTSVKKLSSTAFSVSSVKEYYHQGLYKYTVGSFTDLNSTYRFRDSLRTRGYSQAFVVCFWGTERIDIKEAIRRMN